MSVDEITLRALEPEDIEILEKVENDSSYWHYSSQTEPFSFHTLRQFIDQQGQDIFEVKQKRFVISNSKKKVLGFVDLFDFEPLHRRAGVGIFVLEPHRECGVGKKALSLLHQFAKTHLNMKNLFANVGDENRASTKLFLASGYREVGIMKDWNFYNAIFHDQYLYQKTL